MADNFRISVPHELIRKNSTATDADVEAITDAMLKRAKAFLAEGAQESGLERMRVGNFDVLFELVPSQRLLKVLSVRPFLPS